MVAPLTREGFDIACARSGAEALDLLARENFDAIVSDQKMPEMSGVQLLSSVRDEYPHIARIILSGEATLEAAVQAINAADVFQFLMKPCAAKEVAATLRCAVEIQKEQRDHAAWAALNNVRDDRERSELFDEALARLELAYQPILHAWSQELYGYEVLMRCQHPDFKSPLQVLEAAQAAGRSSELAARVLGIVVETLSAIPDHAAVFINMEVSQLFSQDLFGPGHAIHEHSERVVIEVTEREPLPAVDQLDTRIQQLREWGYRVAVDDFGSGHAGLNGFALMCPDLVKIDMELVREINFSPTRQRLVNAMANACRDLGIPCVAEGVETADEAYMLRDLGCDMVQGYFFGRPCSLAQLRAESEAA